MFVTLIFNHRLAYGKLHFARGLAFDGKDGNTRHVTVLVFFSVLDKVTVFVFFHVLDQTYHCVFCVLDQTYHCVFLCFRSDLSLCSCFCNVSDRTCHFVCVFFDVLDQTCHCVCVFFDVLDQTCHCVCGFPKIWRSFGVHAADRFYSIFGDYVTRKVGTPDITFKQVSHCYRYCYKVAHVCVPSKNRTLTQCRFNVGPPSQTVAQH